MTNKLQKTSAGWRLYARWALYLVTALLALVTIAGIVESPTWWIRVWDFPRTLILCVALLTAGLGLIILSGRSRIVAAIILLAVSGWQLREILPYTPLNEIEVAMLPPEGGPEARHCFSAMSYNVYQDNRDFDRTIAAINKYDPDILLLLETDQPWNDALTETLKRYPHRTEEPLGNTYGLIFASRLPVKSAEIRYLIKDDIPSIKARMTTSAGRPFLLLGLHPEPPKPGKDVAPRNAEIVIAARDARQAGIPVLAMGDFNDVAWSRTSRVFKRLGEYNDPRVGRGLFATFPADWPIFRWPLDHLFITEEFVLADLEVLDPVGSDHLPVFTRLCLEPETGEVVNEEPEDATAEDDEDAKEMVEEAEEQLATEDSE